ncbi:ABC transporter permease [Planomonospora parontospora subsp. parontospora]|uniref:ABC transporter permease n=2 Tax=Planomonospora parontospora TaxID=58119 RepID=A0AA37F7K8_9ACTN|nr:ABC transporter permease [Planomonospora parontospora]GGK90054.1 ABC transporter permease [Planomonospora parontospora]GII11688.1 ABC transporter permease [Planomonospora parontospora subsp. parontospora]
MNLTRYAARRLAVGAVQVAAVTGLVFLMTEALPGDAAVVLAGDQPDPARIAQIRAELGLDRPLAERFTAWAAGMARGDFGASLVSGRPVAEIVLDALAPTAVLAGLTLLLLIPLSVLLGVAAALREGGRLDRALTAAGAALYAVPEFALAIVLVAVFGVALAWLPPTGLGGLTAATLVLPVTVLLVRPVCSTGRLIRSTMIDVLAAPYVRHARRLGLGRFAHALPNALAPAVQHLARTADWLLGGVIVVEAVFVIPGLGSALADAVGQRDLPVLQGLALLFAATTVLVNLLADVAAFRLAPRA